MPMARKVFVAFEWKKRTKSALQLILRALVGGDLVCFHAAPTLEGEVEVVSALGALDGLSLVGHEVIHFIHHGGGDFAAVGLVGAFDLNVDGKLADDHPAAGLHDLLVGVGLDDGARLGLSGIADGSCLDAETSRQAAGEQHEEHQVPPRTGVTAFLTHWDLAEPPDISIMAHAKVLVMLISD